MQVFFALWVCEEEGAFSSLPRKPSWLRAQGLPPTLPLPLFGVLLLSETFDLARKIKRMILGFDSVCRVYSDVISPWKVTLGTAEWASSCQHFQCVEVYGAPGTGLFLLRGAQHSPLK